MVPCARKRFAVSHVPSLISATMMISARRFHARLLWMRYFLDLWLGIISIDPPDSPIPEVLQEFFILQFTHVACPYNFCVVDVGFIPHPLAIHVVMVPVADEH